MRPRINPPKIIRQCKSCPWRVACMPDRDIPGYSLDLHKGLARTIASGLEFQLDELRCMSCHCSKTGEEFACAGWLHHQLGIGNNIGVRMAMMQGQLPRPEIDGDQHESFEDTMTPQRKDSSSKEAPASASTETPATAPSPAPTLPQTICLLALASGEQPRLLPPITRARLISYRWIVLVERRQPGSKGKTRYAITAAGREALERSKYLDEAKRKIERRRQEVPW